MGAKYLNMFFSRRKKKIFFFFIKQTLSVYKLQQPLIQMQEEQQGKRVLCRSAMEKKAAKSRPITQIRPFLKEQTGEETQDVS